MHRAAVTLTIWLLAGLLLAPAAAQEDWLQFRGPAAGVVPDDSNLPERWSETENVVWTTDIPGLAWSSPVVTGDLVFITTAVSEGDEPDPVKGLYDPGMENGLGGLREHSPLGCSTPSTSTPARCGGNGNSTPRRRRRSAT